MTPPLLQCDPCVSVRRPEKKLADFEIIVLIATVNSARVEKDGESNEDLARRPRSFVHAAVAAAAALGHRLRRLRRRTSPPSWLVGALRRLRALALAPSLASDYSSTQRAAVSTTSCAARSSSAGARQVEERVRSHPRRAVRRPGWLPWRRLLGAQLLLCAQNCVA